MIPRERGPCGLRQGPESIFFQERWDVCVLTDTLPARCPAAPAEPLGKPHLPGYDICHQAPTQCCHLPSLCTCSPHEGSVSWPTACSLPQPALVKVTGLPLVTAMAQSVLSSERETRRCCCAFIFQLKILSVREKKLTIKIFNSLLCELSYLPQSWVHSLIPCVSWALLPGLLSSRRHHKEGQKYHIC